ncbi:MAG: type III-B CRISPR module RAMP protein Cmr4 [Ostreibacterium sp.]
MKTTLLSLHAQTSIHAGSGQTDSVIDLPIQRESHTGYPCVFGSSMKGALRDFFEQQAHRQTAHLFGSEENDQGHAGALLISDARLLLLPIRSLTGSFRWVTCPAILRRFKKDSKRFGKAITLGVPEVDPEQVLTAKGEETLYLEEYCFKKPNNTDNSSALVGEWVACLADFINDEAAKILLEQQLAIISDTDFAYLAHYTLPVNARNVLNDNKTSDNLWYEEILPSETILYLGVAAEKSRGNAEMTDKEVMQSFQEALADKWLQVGGNETIGMGWFYVACHNRSDNEVGE